MNRREFVASVAGIAMIPVAVKKEPKFVFSVTFNGSELQDDHIVMQLLSDIPDYAFRLFETFGSVYLYKSRNSFQMPVRLHAISPQFVMKKPDGQYRVTAGYQGAAIHDIPACDIIEITNDGRGIIPAFTSAIDAAIRESFWCHTLHVSLEETA